MDVLMYQLSKEMKKISRLGVTGKRKKVKSVVEGRRGSQVAARHLHNSSLNTSSSSKAGQH